MSSAPRFSPSPNDSSSNDSSASPSHLERATERPAFELLAGGARRDEANSGEEAAPSGDLSSDLLEALAADSPLLPPREPVGARLANYFGRHHLVLFVLAFLALWALVALPPRGQISDVRVGDPVPRDLIAPQTTFVRDEAEIEQRREDAAALVSPVYDADPSAPTRALAALDAALDRLRLQVANSASGAASNNASTLNSENARDLTPATLSRWRASNVRWDRVAFLARDAVRQGYERARVRSDVEADEAALRARLRQNIQTAGAGVAAETPARRRATAAATTPSATVFETTELERQIALQLAVEAARFPNLVVNAEGTQKAREVARDAVLPVFQRIEANTLVVREGERITPTQWDQLQALELARPDLDWKAALATGALCFLLVSSAAFYLGRARGASCEPTAPATLWLVAFVPIAFLIGFRLLTGVPGTELLVIPLAATAAMLVTVLIEARYGVLCGFVVAAGCALMARLDAPTVVAAVLAASVGAGVVAHLSSRFVLLRATLVMALVGALLSAALGVLHERPVDEHWAAIGWSALAGVLAVVAMAGGAILLERPFGITSHLRLLELLSPDEAVLRRMQVEAPGTYTHSMMVAALAEAAAKAVGADPLLCRVAGTYHDIGKLRRPGCFIENQAGQNIHDRLSPGVSALLIKAHVSDGLKLGRAIRLPQPVLEIIASHHGTTLVSFFYVRAQELGKNSNTPVDEKMFRYAGPRPRSKEAAIVMLADSVEASARSLDKTTPEAVEKHVAAIVEARVSEGELAECDLTQREIAVVREALTVTLRGALHGRIAYPDPTSLARRDDDWVAQTLGHAPTPVAAPETQTRVPSPISKRKRRRARAGREAEASSEAAGS